MTFSFYLLLISFDSLLYRNDCCIASQNPIWSSAAAAAAGCQSRQGGQEWRCRGVGSQGWLSECQRGEAAQRGSAQSARWCRLSTGPLEEEEEEEEGWGWARLGSSHAVSLNWCLESRNVSSSGTCFVCQCFQQAAWLPSRSSPCNSPESEKAWTRGSYWIWRQPLPSLNVALCSSLWYLCVNCRAEWNGACPYICLLCFPPPSSGSTSVFRGVDLSADGVNCSPRTVKARRTVSALYATTTRLGF